MKAIIFDFDGLIVDTESIWFDAYREVLGNHGLELTLERFSKVIGTKDDEFYSYIQEHIQVEKEVIETAAHDLYHVKMGEPVLRDGVAEYLNEAKEIGLKIGLASSSSREWVEGYLKRFNILHYFDVVKTRNDVSAVKPDPELYQRALESLGVSPFEAIAFEDSLNGLKAARAAGIPCVIVPNPVTAHLDFADHSLRLSSMGELGLKKVIDILDQRNRSIRLGTAADEEFLWDMLYQAIFIPEGEPRPSKDILKEPHIAQSLSGWGRKGDTALIALDENQEPAGAVWVRLYDDTNKTYGYVDNQTPLLGMALLPAYRGKGLGTALLKEMLKVTKESGYEAVSLSVDPHNPAIHLYRKFGFEKIGEDGTSWDMLVKF